MRSGLECSPLPGLSGLRARWSVTAYVLLPAACLASWLCVLINLGFFSSHCSYRQIGHELGPEEMWNRLAHAIGEVQNHKASTLSYEEHYRYAYNLVLVSMAMSYAHRVRP